MNLGMSISFLNLNQFCMKKLIMLVLIVAFSSLAVIASNGKVVDKETKETIKVENLSRFLQASISFTDNCGNQLTISGNCASCTNITEWLGAFNNWWSQNSSGGCINPEWLP